MKRQNRYAHANRTRMLTPFGLWVGMFSLPSALPPPTSSFGCSAKARKGAPPLEGFSFFSRSRKSIDFKALCLQRERAAETKSETKTDNDHDTDHDDHDNDHEEHPQKKEVRAWAK